MYKPRHDNRAGDEGQGRNPRKRASFFGLWCLGTVFASATAEAETVHKWHRRQARQGAAGAGGRWLIREIAVFPALAQAYTKKDTRYDLDASDGESVGFVECSDSGAEQSTQSRRSWLRRVVS